MFGKGVYSERSVLFPNLLMSLNLRTDSVAFLIKGNISPDLLT